MKTFKDRNFFKDIQRTEDFQKNLKKIAQFKKYALWKQDQKSIDAIFAQLQDLQL